jgi:hypothetical protein
LDTEKHHIAEEEFLTLEKAGIICRSNSLWASPLHLVPKKDGSWRPCGDYRRLNAVTIPERYPLPNMQSLNDRMAGCTVFSKIDLVKAYHQIPIAEEDIQKTAIATPFGLWEFLFMAFGLRNAAQALQRLKDNILMGLDYVFSFLDDDSVFSKSKEEHWTHLRTLFAILATNGLALNLEKCVFAASELDFLGRKRHPPLGQRSGHFGFSYTHGLQSHATVPRYDKFIPPFPPWGRRDSPPAHRRTLR